MMQKNCEDIKQENMELKTQAIENEKETMMLRTALDRQDREIKRLQGELARSHSLLEMGIPKPQGIEEDYARMMNAAAAA